jgi:hypothetical protein
MEQGGLQRYKYRQGTCRVYEKHQKIVISAVTHLDGDGYNLVQFFTYLRAYSAAQKEIIKQAKNEICNL